MLTKEERREKAHRHFISTWGEEIGTRMWKEYCEKSDLLPEKKKSKEAKPEKPK